MDANGFSDSDVENWTVDPPADEYEAPIFPIVCWGRKWSISFWDRAEPLRRMESNKAFKWNNYLNVALHQLPCRCFVMAPLGSIEMCRVDFCVRWRCTTTHLTIWNKQITVLIVCDGEGSLRYKVMELRSHCFGIPGSSWWALGDKRGDQARKQSSRAWLASGTHELWVMIRSNKQK